MDLRTAAPDGFEIVLPGGAALRGRVVDAAGRPVADAEVHVPDRLARDGTREVPVEPDGTFDIQGYAPDLGPTEVTVHVHRKGRRCPDASFTLTPGAPQTDLAVRLEPAPPER